MDTCRVCKVQFVAPPARARKKDFICNPCDRIRSKEYRARRKLEGRPVISTKMPREYHRQYEKAYYANPEVKAKRAAQMKEYQSPDSLLRHKHEARWAVHRAVESGRLIKLPCVVCGEVESEGHHEDYSKPLEVIWLCKTHHAEHHAKARGEING